MAKRQHKEKTVFDGDLYENYINLARATKLPYTLVISNYKTEIDWAGLPIVFMQNVMNDDAFKAANMLKADLIAGRWVTPEITQADLTYYKFAIPERIKRAGKTVYNIDIKSAYASVLQQTGVITPRTAAFMARLAKVDRLACIGMLASNKTYWDYDGNGELTGTPVNVRADTAGWFFYCVREVQRLMDGIRSIIGKDFLFYWVDGIYFENESHREAIEAYLTAEGYRNSFDILKRFKCHEEPNNHTIYFEKDNPKAPKGYDQKLFRIPKFDVEVNKRILEILQLHSEEARIIKDA